MKPGDVVSLPGGPKMVVERIDGDAIECAWMDCGDLKRGAFRRQDLIP
jgi:uncharacterized protein YodC (DUF2158 family)